MLDNKLLNILVCPNCFKKLVYRENKLICEFDKLYYEIINNIPVMLKNTSKQI